MRNNQRRSRARKKDYIAELEEKVHRYETSGNQSIASRTVQQVMKENDMLKKLLQSMGLGNDFLKVYTNASEKALEISKPIVQYSELDRKDCCKNGSNGTQVCD